ncbi:L-glutamine:2-deoxy-scyllo-inosose/3-amino-2,3-dideoxy-scyllo-inosose aminotransferase [Catenulispora sp. GP43]|uniref:DegT/DnrJ/EryC1/StrS family aminotransferase n=1 Tax=Catenulispora sp. GP43 TaxID=3156263 RepID=UPI00351462A9
MSKLAINGGRPLWAAGWPAWPTATESTRQKTLECLESGRWAISGPKAEGPGSEAAFAREFADFLGARHCVPTTNGTSALVTALEALDVGAGDEVIVPGITWVASASTAMAVNALPVIVDVDPRTLCLDPAAVEAAITPRTKALSIVHLYNSVCDLDALTELCRRYGLGLIEDCAQAHGARWRGRAVGLWGDVGTFSMQQTKLLTAGEGGVAVTDDDDLYRRMYQLRSDGRSRVADPRVGEMELSLTGEVMGSNYCMPELTAAVLSGQLLELPAQNKMRAENAATLDASLREIPGVAPVEALEGVTERTHYYYVFRIDPEAFAGFDASVVSAALRAETGAPFQTTYPPLPGHPLLRPDSKRRYGAIPGIERLTQTSVPAAEDAYRCCVTLHHPALLADPAQMAVLAEAVAKVAQNAGELAQVSGDMENPL